VTISYILIYSISIFYFLFIVTYFNFIKVINHDTIFKSVDYLLFFYALY